jgi:hypothetical protein
MRNKFDNREPDSGTTLLQYVHALGKHKQLPKSVPDKKA